VSGIWEHLTCRLCNGVELAPVLDLGSQHLSEFREDASRPPTAPLELVWCAACSLLQLRYTVSPELLFHGSYSFKSGVSEAIRADLADVAGWARRFVPEPKAWLDVGSNDGTLLSYVPREVYRAGIDPLGQFAREAWRHADQVIVAAFDPAYFNRQFDVITAVSVFYDLDDPGEFCRQAAELLAPDGVLVIQQNYLPDMLAARSVDNVSHEHLTYQRLGTLQPLLQRAGLQVVDVIRSAVNGGCFRVAAVHGPRKGSLEVRAWNLPEAQQQLGSLRPYQAFALAARTALDRLGDHVRRIVERGARVYVYGASTRGAVLWQAAGLDVTQLPAVVDRNPAKVGRWMSAIGSPIISEEAMRADPPDVLLVGPWWMRDQFITRERKFLEDGGEILIPLPHLELVNDLGGRRIV
jgi:NDP-4-keto-2,6-dideoxyhexose 3-C-methyltransferase